MGQGTGWIVDGFTAWTFLVFWVAIVLIHGIGRSLGDAKPDAIRESGPTS